jgi:putative metallohydrolase (TIGR04338 family)
MSSDPQQYRVYDAERVFNNGVGVIMFRSLDDIQKFVDKIVASDWWKDRCDVEAVRVFLGRKDSGTAKSYPRFASWRGIVQTVPFITIPPTWAATDIVVIHELAHTCAGLKERHGPVFARCYLDMLATFSSRSNALKLQKSFDAERVEYGTGPIKTDRQVETEAAKQQSTPSLSDADIAFLRMTGILKPNA